MRTNPRWGPYAKACTNFTCSGQTATASRQTYNVTFRDLATDCFNIDVYTNAIAYRPYSANSAAEAESCGSTELANCTPTAAYAGNLQNFCVAGFKELSDTPEHAQRCIGFRYNVYGAPYACTW